MRIPFFGRREVRDASPQAYTDLVLAGLLAQQSGRASDPVASATGAVQSAAGMWARCMAVAEVSPEHPALNGTVLSKIAYDLGTLGESVWCIDVGPAGVQLLRGSSWSIDGGPDPATWIYDVTMSGPSHLVTRRVPAAAVVHVRYLPDARQPWRGVAPWQRAPELSALAAGVESQLRREMRQPVQSLIPMPQGTAKDARDALREDIQNAAYSVAFPQHHEGRLWFRRGVQLPSPTGIPKRLQADPQPGTVQLCRDVPVAVAGLFGIPPVLVSGSGSETQTQGGVSAVRGGDRWRRWRP